MSARLSVIIPTRDRPDVLRDCLATLQRQRVAPGDVEVVVVDDGSDIELAPLVAAAEGPLALRCVRQQPGGLNGARNRGVAETAGEVVAFLDDDTLVEPHWAAAVITAFASTPCAGLGGRVELALEGPRPDWLTRRQTTYLAEFELGGERRWLDAGPVPVGANCAVRRVDLERVGGFRPGLDRMAGSLVSNGDTEFFRRLRDAGGRLLYEPAAHVRHRVPAERLTRAFFRRRAYAQGVSDVLIARPGETRPRGVLVARELWRYGRTGPILVRGMATGRGPMNGLQWTSYCRGRLDAINDRSR